MNFLQSTIACVILGCIVCAMITVAPVYGDSDEILAKIGDVNITRADLNAKLEEIPSYARTNFETEEGLLKLLDRMVRTELLMQAALSDNYMERPDIKMKVEDATRRILTSEYFKVEMSAPQKPPEQNVQKYYEEHKDEYRTKATAEVSHILFENENDAVDVRKKLKDGDTTFVDAVAKFSIDRETKSRDGQMGTVREDGFIKGIGRSGVFESIVFTMKPGEISDPVKSRKGWHILRLDSRTDAGFIPLENVRQQIEEELMVTDEDIEKEYQADSEKYKTRARCKIKHILTASEDDAKSVYIALNDGTDFTELVQTKSIDMASVKQQGSLGYLYEDGYVRGVGKDPKFEKAVFALKPGSYSKPLKTKKGWHIVLLEEKTDESLKPLADVKVQIKNKLIRDRKENNLESRFEGLKTRFKCKVYEDKIQVK